MAYRIFDDYMEVTGSKLRIGLLPCLALLVFAFSSSAQDASRSLLETEPFDQITLDAANDNSVIKVTPIRFPGGMPPESPKPSDKLTVNLVETGREYEVAWRHIAKLELFQDLLLDELKKLSAEEKFDEAYEYLLHLRSNYPRTRGLEDAHHRYLYQSAGGAFRHGNFAEALGLLEELHRRVPGYRLSADGPTLIQVLGSAADRLIGEYVAKSDYRSARALLSRLKQQYAGADFPFAAKWQEDLAEQASKQRDAARSALANEDFVAAYDAFARMREIWPDVEGGSKLASEMAEIYPLVRVGVSAGAQQHDPRSIVDPGARRTGRLVRLPLFEYEGAGPEGGMYQSPLGETEVSDDGRQLTLQITPSTARLGSSTEDSGSLAPVFDGYRLSRYLLTSAEGAATDSEEALSRLIESVEVEEVWHVAINFRRSHVLPQAVLQGVLPPETEERLGRYRRLSASENLTRYIASGRRSPGEVAEIVEQAFDDPQRAVLALRRGEIDVLERVFPGDISELKADRSVAVGTFSLPSTHLIVVRHHSPYLASRTFRRSLVYGSDRETILRQTILRGDSLPGFRVVSAPFPAPTAAGEVVAYGYDQRIAPREYDPRLALTLRILGQREVKAVYDQRKQKLPALKALTLAHPADETARIACRALAAQWKAIGIAVDPVELPPGQYLDADATHDLLYVEACLAEPLVDARRLLGSEGLAPADSNFIQLCLRRIDSASNWQQAREHFKQLHRLLHEDVTVIPLWQMYDHFAFRRTIQGIGQNPVSLYDNVERWRLSPQVVGN